MPLQLPHKELDLFIFSKKLLHSCYEITNDLPADVQKTLGYEMRKAALFVYLNTCKSLAKASKKKKRKGYEWAKDQLIVIDAILEVLVELKYADREQEQTINDLMTPCYKILSDLTSTDKK
jgi:four helix bundle protein